MMFKILVIQAANNLSDERTEFLINDRLSFMRFLGLGLPSGFRTPHDLAVPGKLTRAEAIKPLFDRFDAAVREAGYIAMAGQIVDAWLIAAPKQRNTEEEKAASRRGASRRPGARTRPGSVTRTATRAGRSSSARPRRGPMGRPPVDIAIPTFGYQNHISIDRRHGLIRRWEVTDAAAYEGRVLRHGLLDRTNTGSSRVGRHGLSLEGERGVPGEERLHQPHPSQEARRPADAHADPPRQWPQVCRAFAHRACLR